MLLTQVQIDDLQAGDVIESGLLFGRLSDEKIVWEVVSKDSRGALHLSASWYGVMIGPYVYKLDGRASCGYTLRRG